MTFEFRGFTWSLARNFVTYVDGDTTIPVLCRFGFAWWTSAGVNYRFCTTSSNGSKLGTREGQIGTIWQGNYQWDIWFQQTAYTLKIGRNGMRLILADRCIALLRQTSYGKLTASFHANNDHLIPLLIFVCLQYHH